MDGGALGNSCPGDDDATIALVGGGALNGGALGGGGGALKEGNGCPDDDDATSARFGGGALCEYTCHARLALSSREYTCQKGIAGGAVAL